MKLETSCISFAGRGVDNVMTLMGRRRPNMVVASGAACPLVRCVLQVSVAKDGRRSSGAADHELTLGLHDGAFPKRVFSSPLGAAIFSNVAQGRDNAVFHGNVMLKARIRSDAKAMIATVEEFEHFAQKNFAQKSFTQMKQASGNSGWPVRIWLRGQDLNL